VAGLAAQGAVVAAVDKRRSDQGRQILFPSGETLMSG
jgi:hypothetical protein